MPEIQPVIEQLNRVRAALLAVADSIPAEQWKRQPPAGGWSTAEVIAHLTMVEEAILQGARKVVAAEPRPTPLWKRLHIPAPLVKYRLLKARTPLPLDPAFVGEKEPMLERIRASRLQTLTFLDENRQRDLRRWRFPHPLLGSLNVHTWFKLLGYHEARHTGQMREIARSLGNE